MALSDFTLFELVRTSHVNKIVRSVQIPYYNMYVHKSSTMLMIYIILVMCSFCFRVIIQFLSTTQ